MGKKNITFSDIAKYTGFSKTTISRYFNNPDSLTLENQQIIATALEKLNYKENNFLAAVHFGKASCGVAFLDISTGEFLTAEGPFDYIDKLLNNFGPKEILFERGKRLMFEGNFGSKFFTFELDDWVFTETTAREKLLKHFEVKNLKGFGVEHLKNGIIASGAVLQYLIMTQHTQIGHITSLARIEEDKYVRLDKFTVRSLELMGSMNDGGSSLLNVIDRTRNRSMSV